MLLGLLNRDPAKNAAAIKILKSLMNRGERNDIIHSISMPVGDRMTFTRRKSDGTFRVKAFSMTGKELAVLSLEMAELAVGLQNALGITADSYTRSLQEAHKAAAKLAKSPSPPKASRTSRLSASQAR